MEIGVYTFVENTPDPATGRLLSPAQRLRDLIEEVVLADQVGLEVFGIGEHHRSDFLASAPTIMLAAAAERTKAIRLTSAVTVLSSDDPVRVYQQYATLDLLSGGRAEIMAGRGSFIESFPLFGYDLNDYDSLFAEKLELLLKIPSKFKAESFGVLQPDGTLKAPAKMPQSLTHVVMKLGRFKEWQVSLLLILMVAAWCSLVSLIFWMYTQGLIA